MSHKNNKKKTENDIKTNKSSWFTFHTILFLLPAILILCSTATFVLNIFQSNGLNYAREKIKSRLMYQIEYDGWDPYSSNMSLDEFYALMELFNEGKLPLAMKTSSNAYANAQQTTYYIPRTQFMFSGLPDTFLGDESDVDSLLPYDNNNDYEEYDKTEQGEPIYYYPKGLNVYGLNYKRPPLSWNGLKVNPKGLKVMIVVDGINDGDKSNWGDVNQDLFIGYNEYYVKQVTINGTDIKILGMLQIPETERWVYYYLSTESQNTQVSTTTLSGKEKFIVEYVPIEHSVDYAIILDTENLNQALDDAIDRVNANKEAGLMGNHVSQSVTNLDNRITIDSVFTNRPDRTANGAYAFDVIAPYNYQTSIYICINMEVKIPYIDSDGNQISLEKEHFPVKINHTGKRYDAEVDWLRSYGTFLYNLGLVPHAEENGQFSLGQFYYQYIDRTPSFNDRDEAESGNLKITMKWKNPDYPNPNNPDPNTLAHNSVLERMVERINDFVVHNNGYALGTYPEYITDTSRSDYKLKLDTSKGPSNYDWIETFYNSLVKADRIIIAVVKPYDTPTFDISQILQSSNGAGSNGPGGGRATAFHMGETYNWDAEYEYHVNGKGSDPHNHNAGFPNLPMRDNYWNWNSSDYYTKSDKMIKNSDGTYRYEFVFQTNSGNFLMDVLEINGLAMSLPYRPMVQWSNYDNGNTPKYDEEFPCSVENTLPDGGKVYIEFLIGWNNAQRIYRIRVEGAKSNVTVTGLNLNMFGDGAPEFSVYNLIGIHSDITGESHSTEAIEYFSSKSKKWERTEKSVVVISSIDYGGGDKDYCYANLRFKIAEGFGSPAYKWESPRFGIIYGTNQEPQTSYVVEGGSTTTATNKTQDMNEFKKGGGTHLSSMYIYDGGDGYHYIRVTGQNKGDGNVANGRYTIALLTIIAKPVKYVIRYLPSYASATANSTTNSFYSSPDGLTGIVDNPEGLPNYEHNGDCVFSSIEGHAARVGNQYDDNNGTYYDMLKHNMVSMPSNEYGGVIRPADPNNEYVFVDWILIGEDYMPVHDNHGNEIHYLSGAFDLNDLAEHTVHRVVFSSDELDIFVLRFIPYWKKIEHPYIYDVVINWVDLQGEIHQANFHEFWDNVVTEEPDDGILYVYVNKFAAPLLDWIAMHPTYYFWDDVNNAVSDAQIDKAIKQYLDEINFSLLGKDYNTIFESISLAVKNRDYTGNNVYDYGGNGVDDFIRLGGYLFSVHENNATISIWLYESLGGIVFHNDIKGETLESDEEFYFSITGNELNDTYMAYPEHVYDDKGNEREVTFADTFQVTFENGVITSIVKGEITYTHFTLKAGEGLQIYLPEGTYTLVEVGTKSGGAYNVSVNYYGSNSTVGWELPDTNTDNWLYGSSTGIKSGKGISQISAQIKFMAGKENIIRTLYFYNRTSLLSVSMDMMSIPEELQDLYYNMEVEQIITLTLPGGYTPLLYKDENVSYYYYNINIYHIINGKTVIVSEKLVFTKSQQNETNTWIASVNLIKGEKAVIIMQSKSTYKVSEDNVFLSANGLIGNWSTGNEGIALPGETIIVSVVNSYGPIIESQYGYLVITVTCTNESESFLKKSFLFLITDGSGNQLMVSVKGGKKTYVYAPTGIYTIKEITDSDWSWQYDDNVSTEGSTTITVEITSGNDSYQNAVHADFYCERNNKRWLGGENNKNNFFA